MKLLLFTKNIEEYQIIISQFQSLSSNCKIIYSDNHPRKKDSYFKIFLDEIKLFNPKLIIAFFYDKYIQSEIIDCSKHAFNYHPSILPNYRGPHAINWQIINGEKKTGVTIHELSNKIDVGDILIQDYFNINLNDDVNIVLKKAINSSILLTTILFSKLKSNEIILKKQFLKGNEFVCTLRKPEDGELKVDMTDDEMYNMIRALAYPWPGAYYYVNMKDKKFINKMITFSKVIKIKGEIHYK